MGSIRSRRKKLTTLLTDVNTRLKSVELRSVASLAAEAASLETDENLVTPGSYISGIAPSTWKRVIAGWYYPKQVTGLANDRVELFLNVDSGLEVDEVLEVSGINSPVQVSKKRKVLGTGQAVGDYRNNKSWYKPIPAGITHTLLYSVGAEPSFKVARALKTRFIISSFSATTTTATIVFGEVHNFNQGDVINISDLGGNMAGIDGLFYVDTVPSTTSITYKFDAPIAAAIASTPATANKYVYATVHEFVNLGDSWINTETDPDSLYVWNGIRWIAASDPSSVKKDDKDPGPPTNLEVSTVAYPNEGGDTKASATFSWSAPTTNADGSELTDLGGYEVQWSGPTITGAGGTKWARGGGYAFVETSLDISDLPPGQTVQFRVRTIDTGGRKSVFATISKLMGARSDVLTSPSAPQVTTRLGTVTVRWNGLQSNGSVPPNYLNYLEVHVSSTSNFTPSTSTLSGRIDKSGNDFYVITDLPYNEARYVRLVFVDKDGKKSLPSTQVLVTIKPLVDTDIIGKILDGANIVPGSITASESIIGNTITGNLIQALTIKAGNLEANAITADKINAGAITAVKISANAITADKISAGAITAEKINAGAVTATKIATNSITATNAKIESISANFITAGTLTGRTVTSASAGDRVVLDAANQRIAFYDGTTLRGRIFADSVGLQIRALSAAVPNIRVGSTDITLSAPTSTSFMQLGSAGGVSTFAVTTNEVTFNPADFRIRFLGNGTTTKRYVFTNQDGYLFASTSTAGVSDERLKKDITPTQLGLSLVNSLNPVTFNWKHPAPDEAASKKKQHGLIAQELRDALDAQGVLDSSIVVEEEASYSHLLDADDSDPVLSIDYNQLIPVLISSIKELSAKVESLEEELKTIKDAG